MDNLVQKIIEIVKDCSQIMLEAEDIASHVEKKEGKANFVTDFDKRMQYALEEKLMALLPEAYFMGEEDDKKAPVEHGYVFIVDPIDGTTNFMKGASYSCVSVGLLLEGEPYIGVVYNPYLKEVFYGKKGEGAYRNGVPIRVSDAPLSEGITIFGTAPYYEELTKKSFDLAYYYFEKCLDIRRSGSAALDLCNIACGRAELFFELKICPWDYAAASLIIMEAGGTITDMEGKPLQYAEKTGVLACSQRIRNSL